MGKLVGNNLDFNNAAKIQNLPAGSATGEPVTYEQMNSIVEGIAWKDNVRTKTTANINLASPGANIDGIAMSAGERFLAATQTTVPENGIYIWNGAASAATRATDASVFAELESAVVTVDEGTQAGTTWRQTQVNGIIGTNNVVWTAFGTGAGAASETVSGIAEIATQAETDTGTDDLRIVTPLKMTTWSGRVRKNVTNIGDGAATQYDVTHNFNTKDTVVEVYRNASPWDSILCDVERPDANTTRLRFAVAPTSNQFRVVTWA